MSDVKSALPDPTRREAWEFDKSSRTRGQILDAAMDLLAEDGFASFSANAVATRAGITRAALIYHFPNRAALIEAAVNYVTRRRIAIYQEAIEAAPVDDSFVQVAIDQAWRHLHDNSFAAFCELSIAARTNESLNKAFEPALMEFDRMRRETAKKIFPDVLRSDAAFDLRRDIVRYLLEGLAQQRGMSFNEGERVRDLLSFLNELLSTEEGEALLLRATTRSRRRGKKT